MECPRLCRAAGVGGRRPEASRMALPRLPRTNSTRIQPRSGTQGRDPKRDPVALRCGRRRGFGARSRGILPWNRVFSSAAVLWTHFGMKTRDTTNRRVRPGFAWARTGPRRARKGPKCKTLQAPNGRGDDISAVWRLGRLTLLGAMTILSLLQRSLPTGDTATLWSAAVVCGPWSAPTHIRGPTGPGSGPKGPPKSV